MALYRIFDLNSPPSNAVTSVASYSTVRVAAKYIAVAVIALAIAACAVAPVQEMSDARQAIHSAEAVGATQQSRDTLRMAQRLLQEAQTRLEAGAYDDARRYALDARKAAIQAREQATVTRLRPP